MNIHWLEKVSFLGHLLENYMLGIQDYGSIAVSSNQRKVHT